jgi:hypothetical protein
MRNDKNKIEKRGKGRDGGTNRDRERRETEKE